ncbi:MAG: hypothetical protein QM579_11220 [Desulfovibrio sp.]|uniref:lysozyme inhibitor LprI family protein n=1 Tax=Desulfovibrio sp. TaxID=885 RepID=UPI0039E620E1
MLRNCLAFFRVTLPVFTILALLSFALPAISAENRNSVHSVAATAGTSTTAHGQEAPASDTSAAVKADTAPDKEQDEISPVQAESLYSTEYQICMDSAAGVTTEMQDCINAEQGRLEKIISFRQVALTPVLGEERSKSLHEAVTAWEALRKHGSAAMYDPDGGTLSPLIASLWHLEQTARMAQWLNSLAESAE